MNKTYLSADAALGDLVHDGNLVAVDELLTQTLKSAAALVDVRVLNHLIVADDSVLSMAERGLI